MDFHWDRPVFIIDSIRKKNQTVRINYNRTSTYNRNLKVSTCPHDIVISSQTSNVHQLSFILAPFLWRKICPRLLLQLLLLNLKIFLYVLPFNPVSYLIILYAVLYAILYRLGDIICYIILLERYCEPSILLKQY